MKAFKCDMCLEYVDNGHNTIRIWGRKFVGDNKLWGKGFELCDRCMVELVGRLLGKNEKAQEEENRDMRELEESGLPTRVINSLRKHGYRYAYEVKMASDHDLLMIRNIGPRVLEMIRESMK